MCPPAVQLPHRHPALHCTWVRRYSCVDGTFSLFLLMANTFHIIMPPIRLLVISQFSNRSVQVSSEQFYDSMRSSAANCLVLLYKATQRLTATKCQQIAGIRDTINMENCLMRRWNQSFKDRESAGSNSSVIDWVSHYPVIYLDGSTISQFTLYIVPVTLPSLAERSSTRWHFVSGSSWTFRWKHARCLAFGTARLELRL